MNQLYADIINNTHSEDSITSLGEWLAFWLETYSKPVVRHSTFICYETYIRGHIIPEIGTIKLKALSSDIFQKFFNEKSSAGRLDKQGGGLSAKTIRNIRNMLHLAIDQAIANELLSKNFIEKIKLQRGMKKEIRILSMAEQRTLEEACNASIELIPKGIIIMLGTGMRIGELLALRWSDVNMEDESIVIRNSLRRQNCVQDINRNDYIILSEKKENKTALMIGRVKTTKGNRTIYMTQHVFAALRSIRCYQDNMKQIAGSKSNKMDFLFCTASGAATDARYYQKVFKRFLVKAGVSQTNIHSLRHAFATRALECNFDLNSLADILGHAAPSTTLNMYGHSSNTHKRMLMASLGHTTNPT